jgi:cell wall-associated NlpC family hydrolase
MRVQDNRAEVGDLVFFSTTARGPTHVGIVVGGDQFVHAPGSGGVVRVERLTSPYWSRRLVGVRRVADVN